LSRSRGSAPVDFVLVATPLVLLALTTLGIALNGYAKNIAQDVAIEAARYSALADQSASTASTRAQLVLDGLLGVWARPTVQAQMVELNGTCEMSVTVTLSVVALGFIAPGSLIRESASAVCEYQK
jgi:Flp pilus assembly protein TadG